MNERNLKPNMDFNQEAKMYRNMYLKLFGSVTDALTALDEKDDTLRASYILKMAQIACEEIYIAI